MCLAAGFIVFMGPAEMCGIWGRRAPRGAGLGPRLRPDCPLRPMCVKLARKERSLWLPSSDPRSCRKSPMAARLPNFAHTASPNAVEMHPGCAQAAALSTWTPTDHHSARGGRGLAKYGPPKHASPSTPLERRSGAGDRAFSVHKCRAWPSLLPKVWGEFLLVSSGFSCRPGFFCTEPQVILKDALRATRGVALLCPRGS